MIAIAVKSTVAIVIALSPVAAARRSRASVRHLILAALFVFLLLLPFVQKFAPSVDIEIQETSSAGILPAGSPASSRHVTLFTGRRLVVIACSAL